MVWPGFGSSLATLLRHAFTEIELPARCAIGGKHGHLSGVIDAKLKNVLLQKRNALAAANTLHTEAAGDARKGPDFHPETAPLIPLNPIGIDVDAARLIDGIRRTCMKRAPQLIAKNALDGQFGGEDRGGAKCRQHNNSRSQETVIPEGDQPIRDLSTATISARQIPDNAIAFPG